MTSQESIPAILWRDRPYQRIKTTAEILNASTGYIYSLLKDGRLKAVDMAGLPMVTTQSIIDVLAQTKPWVPNTQRTAIAVAARSNRQSQRRSIRSGARGV